MRIALGIEYDGSQYRGWQRQQSKPSIQAVLEKALSFVANEPISLFCAGRTDAGVHAIGQVVHFETEASRPDVAWIRGVNAKLPDNIAIRWMRTVTHDFHARFSATARHYRYIIYNNKYRSAIFYTGVTHYYLPLDEIKMAHAAACLIGEHDFSAFRSVQCQSKTPWRNIYYLNIRRLRHYVIVDIKANAFVHHMVRNIVGSLLLVGSGQKPQEWIAQLLATRDRALAGPTAKAVGLYLVDVDYPAQYDFPKSTFDPLLINLVIHAN